MKKAFITKSIAAAMIAMALVMVALPACKKNNDINISGITARDENGNLTGAIDTADWRTDRTIPDIVMNTFNTSQYSSVSGGTEAHFCGTVTAYPNPTTGPVVLHISNNCYTAYASQWLLVNKNNLVQQSFDFAVSNGTTSKTISVSGLSAGLYRMYYVFRDPHGTVMAQGYGDIQKQ